MATETLTFNQLQPRLSELIERACQSRDRFFIIRNGHTEAVLLAAGDFEGLLETIEILADTGTVRELIEAEQELGRGEGHALDDIDRELGLEPGSS
jgi:PHD/YefM family antitoxin component YafN of YafNO toxin-antitoxin module